MSAGGNDAEAAAIEWAARYAECHEGVTRGGEWKPCDKTAVALRYDPEEGSPYPVCAYHSRGDMVTLADLLAALAARAADEAETAERPQCPQCGPGYRIGDEGCRHTAAQPTGIEALLLGGLIQWAGDAADLEDCREAAAFLAPMVAKYTAAKPAPARRAEDVLAEVRALAEEHWDWKAGRVLRDRLRALLDAGGGGSDG